MPAYSSSPRCRTWFEVRAHDVGPSADRSPDLVPQRINRWIAVVREDPGVRLMANQKVNTFRDALFEQPLVVVSDTLEHPPAPGFGQQRWLLPVLARQ